MDIPQLKPANLHAEFLQDIRQSLQTFPDALGILIFSNHAMDSAGLGQQCALCYGPSNTVTDLTSPHIAEGRFPFAQAPSGETGWKYRLDGHIPRAELET